MGQDFLDSTYTHYPKKDKTSRMFSPLLIIHSACLVICSLLALLQGEEGGEVQPVLHQILERSHLLYNRKARIKLWNGSESDFS